MTVGELGHVIGHRQANARTHLGLMGDGGLLGPSRQGVHVYSAIDDLTPAAGRMLVSTQLRDQRAYTRTV